MESSASTGFEIALIGMAGRFPAAPSVNELWQRLLAGQECIRTFTDDELRAAGVSANTLADPHYVKAAGVLGDYDRFDAGFFGYSPREAALIDPQQRLFLESAWAALEDAGYAPGTLKGVVGVFGGSGVSDYFHKHVLPSVGGVLDHQTAVANDKDYLTTRVSYKLNLEGPSVAVQTACSTSLVAVHLACQSLIAGECDLALAGGVTIHLPQTTGYLFQEEGIASPDGHCRAFAADARGCVPGSGGAVVVLKRLAEAVADRDSIVAVIKGSAINNDGSRKIGYTAPRVEGQARVIRAALNVADVSAETIGYLEAHGTGTVLGDPIEIEAATKAYRTDTAAVGYCAVGSIKTNLGHLDAGAGVAGLIKAALALKHGVIPPTLHFDRPNPQIAFAQSPFYVAAARREWPRTTHPRRAAVSSFGLGGTNAHVVLEEPPRASESPGGPANVLLLSAKSETALEQASVNLSQHLLDHPELALSAVAHTLRRGRAAFKHRRAVAARDLREAAARLADPAAGHSAVAADAPRIVFMFPGQGSQFPGMGRELYERHGEFRRHVDAAAVFLAPQLGFDLRVAITAPDDAPEIGEMLRETRIAQPAIFTVAHALARLLISWGVTPAALIGHSIGEYVAACLAGVFTPEDALALVAARGRLMSQVDAGAMLAVPLAGDELADDLGDAVSIAALNAPQLSVVSGPHDAVERVRRTLAARGIEGRLLHTSHAFHSPMMDPVLAAFTAEAARVTLRAPQTPLISNVSGGWMQPEQATDPAYWAQHLRGTVRFSDGLHAVLATQPTALVEVGPGQTLTALASRHRIGARPVVALSTTRRPDTTDSSDAVTVLEAAGGLWACGVDITWSNVDGAQDGHRVPLPTYPFQRDRHWIEPAPPVPESESPVDASDFATWFAVPTWERMPRSRRMFSAAVDRWLVFVDDAGIGAAVVHALRAGGHQVTAVRAGGGFGRAADGTFHVNPVTEEDYQQLFASLEHTASGVLGVIHCWNVSFDDDADSERLRSYDGATQTFHSLLAVAKALGMQRWLTRCELTVISNGVHQVVGHERVVPHKALALGPYRVIPLEYQGVTCTHVDVELTVGGPGVATLSRLLETIAEHPAAPIAIRGTTRWRQTSASLPLPPVDRPTTLKERGVYLITGGLGGVGFAVAERLARLVQARLVLVGRTGLPPVSPRASGGDVRIDARAITGSVAQREPHLTAAVRLSPMAMFDGLLPTLDAVAAAMALDYFQRLGADDSASWVDRDELARRCRVTPSFTRLFARMISLLVEDGWITTDGSRVRFTDRPRPKLTEMLRAAETRYPQMAPIFDLLGACAASYPEALAGVIPAMTVLFGEEHREAFRRAVDTVREHSYVPLCEALVKALVVEAASTTQGQALRVLEVGGGEGRLTRVLTPALAGRNVEYQFTDIGRAFVLDAERHAERHGHDFMKCRVLDISRQPSTQGFAPESVDVVLAFNVLHATANIAESLAHAAELLAPGGLLVLQETVRPDRWVDMVWGLTDGWFAFTDESRRTASPLLTLDGWTDALAEAGFDSITAWPLNADMRANADTGVIVARKPVTSSRAAIARRLETHGAEVMIAAADVSNRDEMRVVVRDAIERFGRIDGVVHAALVLDDGAIQLKTRTAVERVFAPKVNGTLVLDQLFEGHGLDFFVVFSSLVALYGGAGQVDYCAASNFQDAWVTTVPASTAQTAMSINWGAWRKVGKAFRSAVERGASPESALPDGMSPDEGVDAFLRALESGQPQTMISPPARSVAAPTSPADVEPATGPVAAATDGRPPNAVEQLIARLWQEVLGLERVGLDDNFFDLGGDSMISLQFIAKARKAGLRFTNRQVFEHQTVAELAAVATEVEQSSSRSRQS